MLIKRILDLIVAVFMAVLLLPMILLTALLVRFFLGPPIFFAQIRPGKNCLPFNLIKFRTMLHADNDSVATDHLRLTKLGQFLRSTSLDELPELWNVLKGDMSLVGPRPLLMEYLPLYTEQQKKRHLVRPGITGWAQINGRNTLSWEERFALDVWYVENRTLWLDIKILFLTLFKVIKREGISQQGHVTMSKFTGNKS